MIKICNDRAHNFFIKLLQIKDNPLFAFEGVFLNGKNLELRFFNSYTFGVELINIIKNDEGNAHYNYSGKLKELSEICEQANKDKRDFNAVFLFAVKNLLNYSGKDINSDFNHLLSKRGGYLEFSFLLGNIHSGISDSSYKEIMKFNFLEEYLSRRNERDGINIQASVCSIEHAEAECTYCNAQGMLSGKTNSFYELGNNFRVDYSYYRPRKDYLYDQYNTYINQNEVIVGGSTDKVEEILNNIDYKKYDYIHINLCCLPTIIGDDLKSIINIHKDKIKIPIIHTDQTRIDPYKILKELLIEIKNESDSKNNIEKNSCVLVGFPHQKGLFELKSILSDYGINIKDILLPIIELDSIKELSSIEQIALIDTGRSEDAIKLFEDNFDNTFRTTSPFGFNNSLKFIDQIIAKFGLKRENNDKLDNKIRSFKSLIDKNDIQIGFILLPNHLSSFLGKFRGIDIINILSEMGFKINIFYYIDENSEHKDLLENLFNEKIPKNNKGDIVLSTKDETLEKFILNDKIDLYYSEVKNDSRILKNRKQVFSTSVFEAGLDGIIRSFNYLTKLANISRNIRTKLK